MTIWLLEGSEAYATEAAALKAALKCVLTAMETWKPNDEDLEILKVLLSAKKDRLALRFFNLICETKSRVNAALNSPVEISEVRVQE